MCIYLYEFIHTYIVHLIQSNSLPFSLSTFSLLSFPFSRFQNIPSRILIHFQLMLSQSIPSC